MGSLFLPFKSDVSSIQLPEKFTYPFNYLPHAISQLAASELQDYIMHQTEWQHDFGLSASSSKHAIGKMFGVLVCIDKQGTLGQLWAFSGKLAEGNEWTHFVPTVFDMLHQEGFYKKGEAILNEYNRNIKELETSKEYLALLEAQKEVLETFRLQIDLQKKRIKSLKKERALKRQKALLIMSEEELQVFNHQLNEESKKENIILKKINKQYKISLENKAKEIEGYQKQLKKLKQARKQKSADLQQQLFAEYAFLNIYKETKSLGEIFDNNPPAGAGECCAPKLLQYAFQHDLKPIAMAEFWWGKSPSSEIRRHQHFYPSCRSKCEPILVKQMLLGLEVEFNPLEKAAVSAKEIEVIFEDQWLAVINKPEGLLSVPGKRIKDSVFTRVQQLFPKATGPLLVHRLDRATSGILLVAKDLKTYVDLQKQFTARTVKKRYIALLDGVLDQLKGQIDLPLRVDLDNRPQQLVCGTYGKKAVTKYKVLRNEANKTLVHFFPITGRTHQLRVHSAHYLGLNTPIVGDDIYGTPAKRLCLHAEWLRFEHPRKKELMTFEIKINFS